MLVVMIVVSAFIGTPLVSKAASMRKDVKVKEAQTWLNKTYAGREGFTQITADGNYGPQTRKALVKGLQIELGFKGANVDGNFGDGTEAKVPTIKVSDKKYNKNIIRIIQYGLFCKGYNAGKCDGVYHKDTQTEFRKFQTDCGFTHTGTINGEWLRGLLSSYDMKKTAKGNNTIRKVQQVINRNYYKYFNLGPCDGVYTSDLNTKMVKAMQIDSGIDPKEANGNYGEQTWAKVPTFKQGCKPHKVIRIIKCALFIKGFYKTGVLDENFDVALTSEIAAYQKFMCLPEKSGIADKGTIKSLMTSHGDQNRVAKGCDTATKLNDVTIATLKNNGYEYVGRYLTKVEGMMDKDLTREEADKILAAGLKIIPIYQTTADVQSYFTAEQGKIDATKANEAALNLGIPAGSTIYYAVDGDFYGDYIIQYFQGINNELKVLGSQYKVGIYAPRRICRKIASVKLATYSYVCDMSNKFEGNKGQNMPTNWAFDQFAGITVEGLGIDKVAVSGRDAGVSMLNDVVEYDTEIVE